MISLMIQTHSTLLYNPGPPKELLWIAHQRYR